jgi:hypothetical protein
MFGYKSSLVLLVLVLSGNLAAAHDDYEVQIASVKDGNNIYFYLFLHYRDGIIGTDPVKLIVYDATGGIVADTDYYRDIVVLESRTQVFVFAIGFRNVFYEHAWVIGDAGQLLTANSLQSLAYSWVAIVRNHYVTYGISFLLTLFAAFVLLAGFSDPPRLPRYSLTIKCAWIAWFCLTVMYGRLSAHAFVTPGVLCVGVFLAMSLWKKGRKKGRK